MTLCAWWMREWDNLLRMRTWPECDAATFMRMRRMTLFSPGRLFLGLPLQLVVGHGDNGEDEIDEVEGAQENVEDEEDYVEWTACH